VVETPVGVDLDDQWRFGRRVLDRVAGQLPEPRHRVQRFSGDVDDHVGAGFALADRGLAGEPVGVFRDACRRVIRDEHGHPWKG
jgi:hypothetical protein